jgi:hypothetical protein
MASLRRERVSASGSPGKLKAVRLIIRDSHMAYLRTREAKSSLVTGVVYVVSFWALYLMDP